MLDLIIVTGASRGIGANIASKCSTITKNLILVASSESINNVRIENGDCRITTLKLDLSDYRAVQDSIYSSLPETRSVRSFGIVLCAAQLGSFGGLFQSDLDEWQKLYQCNVLGNLAVIKSCAQYIDNGARLRAVFFAGGGGAYGYPEFSGYALSKVAVVRSVENLAMEFVSKNIDASVIALAPGAVATDMLATVVAHGGHIKTRTDISEPTNFVTRFLCDEFDSKGLNGRFLHVRDSISKIDFTGANDNLFKLRRIE